MVTRKKGTSTELALGGIDLSPYWFDGEKTGAELAAAVAQTVKALELDNQGPLYEAAAAMSLYNNVRPDIVVMEPTRLGSLWNVYNGSGLANGLSLNVVKACVDTLMAKLGKSRPRVRFITDSGSDGLQQRARRLQRYVEGVFVKENAYRKGKKALKSAIIKGYGAVNVFQDDDGVHVDDVNVNELYVDRQDGVYGRPTELHQKTEASRLQLQLMYPDKADDLATEHEVHWPRATGVRPDKIFVTESWKLPSTEDAKDGRHVICTDKVILRDEPWDRKRFPFVFIRWDSTALADFFTPGLAKELAPKQGVINGMLRNYVKAVKMFSVAKLFVDNLTEIGPGEYNDMIGAIVRYSGQNPPTVSTPQMVVSPQMVDLMWRMYEECFRLAGISQDSAAGERTPGLTSGAAIRENSDLASERFSMLSSDYEDFYLEIADAIIDESQRFHGPKTKVNLMGRGHVERIDWSEVNMDRDRFNLQVLRSSTLPQQPSARLAWIQEMAQAGTIDRDMLYDLLDMPDVSEAEVMLSAPYRAAFHVIDRIVQEGEYMPPDKYMKLDTCLQQALRQYNDMLTWQQPDMERMALLQQFIDECREMIQLQQGTAQPAPAAPGTPANQVAQLPQAAA
ncbi:MAG TPA: hypothetical protein VHC69_31170 [Polyangiaceae bacterium]|nr:hypothetical protein [Polyangiaceae bacterium]